MTRAISVRAINPLHDIAASLELTAETWSKLERAGACACCAARLVGCRETAAYTCEEQDFRAQLTARFAPPPAGRDDLEVTEPADPCSWQKMNPVIAVNDDGGGDCGDGDSPAATRQEHCCTLCLGLLQSKVPVRMAPRARPSSESHHDNSRPCVVALQQHHQQSPSHEHNEDVLAAETASTAHAATSQSDCAPVSYANEVSSDDHTAAAGSAAASGDALAALPPESCPAVSVTMASVDNTSLYQRARMVEAVAKCAYSRGYTIATFGVTVALPACLAVHDAAFVEAIGLGDSAASGTSSVTSSAAGTGACAGIETTPPVISVKEALKLALVEGLQSRLGHAGAVFHSESDFVVEVTAKAPEADAHAKALLLGGAVQPPSGRKKPPGWPGSGRWSMKRQRREEHRNPGLTVGAVKKGLAIIDDVGRARLRCWVERLEARREGWAREAQELKNHEGVAEGNGRIMEEEGGGEVEGVSCLKGVDVDVKDMDNGLIGTKNELGQSTSNVVEKERTSDSSGVKNATPSSTVSASNTNGRSSGSCSNSRGNVSDVGSLDPVRCDIVIRRLPIHFWGRYVKLSRVVPQTPWVKGFFSVQEAVSEPFEEFSGSVEGLLHGSGREDVDVRMLGNGRPFSLELVDSLRSVDEIDARLPALEEAINRGASKKNAGGGVSVSELRVAGPGDLPSDVQRVGEGKRKHYRCVVWVSRAVCEEELKRALCDRPELVVQQTTPVRVLHRRTLMDRPRSIFDMRVNRINDHFFVLDLTTSAGETEQTNTRTTSPFLRAHCMFET